jgi:hypothetical protein
VVVEVAVEIRRQRAFLKYQVMVVVQAVVQENLVLQD